MFLVKIKSWNLLAGQVEVSHKAYKIMP